MTKQRGTAARAAFFLVLLAILSKILGLSRELVMAYKYGANYISDAFLFTFSVPSFIYEGLSVAIIGAYVPIYIELKQRQDGQLKRFNDTLITWSILLSALMILIANVFPNQIIALTAPGFTGRTFDLAADFTRVLSFSILFFLISQILQAYLQANEHFVTTGLTGIPLNLFIVLGTVLSSEEHVQLMSVGVLLAYLSWVLIFAWDSSRLGYRYTPHFEWKNPYVIRLFRLIPPIFLGAAVSQFNMIIARVWASALPEGTITWINYAQRLNSFVIAIFVISIATVVFPSMSEDSSKRDFSALKKTFRSSMNILALILVPISIILIILAEPIVNVLFGRGSFQSQDVIMTAQCLFGYALGLIALGYREMVTRSFYALQDSKTPMYNGIFSVALGILFNFVFVNLMGTAHLGLTISGSLSVTIATFFLTVQLRNKIGNLGGTHMMRSLMKLLFSGLLMSAVTYFGYQFLSGILPAGAMGELLNIALTSIVSIVLYIGIALVLRVPELKDAMALVSGRLKRAR